MKGKTAFNAMEGIDPRYILEAAPDAVVRKGSKAPYIRILAVAATVAVLTAVAVLGAGIMKQSGENPPVVPPVGETQDAQTPAEGEGETASPQDGSYSTDLYTVTEIDGKHYMSFADGNEKPQEGSSGNAMIVKGIYFNSIEEMKQKFLKGNFTTAEVKNLKSQLTLTDKGFEIPDMTQLYDVVLPDGWSVSYVTLTETDIQISFRNEATYNEKIEDFSGESGYMILLTDEQYEKKYQKDIASYIEKIEGSKIQDRTEYLGYPCSMYEDVNDDVKLRVVLMKMEREGSTCEIMLTYCIEHPKKEYVSDTVPYSAYIYGSTNEQKFRVYLSGFENEPDKAFFDSFDIHQLW
ncbi:hypothetical protein [Butyricimonas sp.]|uniref:hypothetical protein n=1 Tax=Butyricimonas sp. TaxID=1969738 RepID=UPI001B16BBE1|nr:hypothetical protein [Butyricimonas sp.]MBO4957748.1 hypothetical protein [Butyricimonas sp.]MBO5510902.1 hypothetical protein [Clostridia bacterium]